MTAYDMRISYLSSYVCSSVLPRRLLYPSAAVDQGVVAPQLHLAGLLLDEGDEADRIGAGVVVEGHGGALGAGVQALDSRLAAQPLDRHDLQQVVHLGRQRAAAVDQLGGEGVDLPPAEVGRAWGRERGCQYEDISVV